ncbi:Vps55 protein [Martiniozyma asiatica (nom. inval.)]|nr:Vps55 protein [Martiniozyma asiatica]
MTPLARIITLSGSLAFGFLLVVLAAALYGNWLPLLVGLLFGVAHLPLLTSGASHELYDEPQWPFGRFVSSFLLSSGILLPIILAHCHILAWTAALLSIVGGSFIWLTVVAFAAFFEPTI